MATDSEIVKGARWAAQGDSVAREMRHLYPEMTGMFPIRVLGQELMIMGRVRPIEGFEDFFHKANDNYPTRRAPCKTCKDFTVHFKNICVRCQMDGVYDA